MLPPPASDAGAFFLVVASSASGTVPPEPNLEGIPLSLADLRYKGEARLSTVNPPHSQSPWLCLTPPVLEGYIR